MLRTNPSAELAFYTHIRSLDLPRKDKYAAILFSRAYADLARRALAARAAQAGEQCRFPASLSLPALKGWLGNDGDFASRFVSEVDRSWDTDTKQLLTGLAGWLEQVYEVGRPESGSYQVWVGAPGSRELRLYGPPASVQPPEPFVLLDTPPITEHLKEAGNRPHSLIGHYDVHGLAMIALTQRFFNQHGADSIDGALSFEWTGDISKLWKRAVPKTILHKKKYGTVVMIDCSVHSRKPEYTRKAVGKLNEASGTSLFIVDHHDDTLLAATELVQEGANVVLTDVLSCGLIAHHGDTELDLMYLGALGDKAPEALSVPDGERIARLSEANREFHRWMIHYSPTPRQFKENEIYPLEPLWEQLAGGAKVEAGLATLTLGTLKPAPPPELPGCARCGELLVVTDKLKTVGRTWYGLLERLMEQEDCAYSAALRILDGRRANFLLLNQWKLIDCPAILSFVPERNLARCLGHPSALWVDLEIDEALPFLESVTRNLNRYMGDEQGLGDAADALTRNVIEG